MEYQHLLPSSFGELLKAYRKRKRLTQRQLAQQLGVHGNTVSLWELGMYLPATRGLVLELARHLELDELETRHLLEASLTALTPHWYVPFPRNSFFTGREKILVELHSQLGVDQAVAMTQSSVLHGLGGVGKTQIALEYAYRHALEYSAVFWIRAETAEHIVASLLCIAEVLQLPERADQDQQRVVAAVQRWLSTHSQWLVIWDNVEDLDLLTLFLPTTHSGATLLTTRSQILGTLTQSMELSPLEQEEAIQFLLRRAKILRPEARSEQVGQFAQRLPVEYAAAEKLVQIMDRLPLALDQAGAYIEETACGFSGYLHRYERQRMLLLDRRGALGGNHPHSVVTTFRLSSERVEQEPSAADLLRVCAFLHAEAIPEELFVEGAAHLGSALASLASDSFQLDQIIAALRNLSLVQRQPETRTLSLHRLVQAVVRDRMSEQECIVWIRRVGAALAAVFPRVTHQVWDQCERLLPHVLAIAMALPDQTSKIESKELAQVFRKAADYLRDRAQYKQAEPLYQRALRILEAEQGLEPCDETAYALNNLAILYFVRGQYERARPLYERALHILEQVLGPEHSDAAYPLSNLALIYKAQAKYEQAELLYRRILHTRELAPGPEHPELAHSLYNLANLYGEMGKDNQAESLHQRALRILEQAFGPEHPDVAYPLHGLATLYLKQHQYERAEPLYRRNLHIRELAFGPEHPLVAHPLHGLARLYLEQNRYAEAEALLLRALSIREQHLAPDHPETALILHDLAILRKAQGDLVEGLALAERALHIRSQMLGETHPHTVATQELYAHLVQEQACAEAGAASECPLGAIPEPCGNERQKNRTSSSLHRAVTPAPSEDNPLQAFLDACCELHSRAWCRSAVLWQAYEQWAEAHQERYPLSRGAFIVQLKAHGCRADRTMTARIWRGIALVQKET